jgi:hypothetical protein
MRNNRQLAEGFYKVFKNKSLLPSQKLKEIENQIAWHIDDVLKLIKNINETSVNEQDRVDRLIHAEHTYGIPKTHLL